VTRSRIASYPEALALGLWFLKNASRPVI